jgi:Protein of unknown function (DUF3443)
MNNSALIACLSLSLVVCACGGGGDSTPVSVPNAQALLVGPGPANNVNLLFTTVQICTPGSASNCQSIDHVLVDTGSSGLRILASVVDPSLSLPQQTDAAGAPLVECGQFVTGNTWGPVKIADVRMAQELARSTPIQLIGDPAFPTIPQPCSGTVLSTADALGANGVLGVSMFEQDCGIICAQGAPGVYFACTALVCRPTQVTLVQQLQNPVTLFTQNNNGIVIDLPSVAPGGAPSVNGSLIFGIGTQGNNAMGSTQVIRVNPTNGVFTTVLNGVTYANSFIDSGSNALYFGSASIPPCSAFRDFFCPGATQVVSATLRGTSGSASVNFQIANAEALFSNNPGFFAFSNLAGPNASDTFDWGLPFFFGRRVFIAIAGQNTPVGVGPYVAF